MRVSRAGRRAPSRSCHRGSHDEKRERAEARGKMEAVSRAQASDRIHPRRPDPHRQRQFP
ncbi:hypothetical protein ACRAWD_24435 [Caulobacter segnis]